jgi:hypothetical protein
MTRLDRELEQLGSISREELVERWQAAYGCPPPAGARRELLVYAAGWHIQVKRLGGFPAEVRRMLRREVERIRRECRVGDTSPQTLVEVRDQQADAGLVNSRGSAADGEGGSEPAAVERRRLVAGARLLREWNGRTHVVDVTEAGYLYEGETYRSLSAIARKITGAHWSGPRFFGL